MLAERGDGWGARAIGALTAWSARRAWGVLALALAVTAAAGFYAQRTFAVSADTLALIDAQVGWRQDEFALYRAFPRTRSTVAIVIDATTPERAEQAAAALAARLAGARHLRDVTRPDGGLFFARSGLLLLTSAQVRATADSMVAGQSLFGPLTADPTLRGVARGFAELAEAAAGERALARLAQPLDRMAVAAEAASAGRRADFSFQALMAASGEAPMTRRLILATPVLDPAALKPGAAASAEVREAAAALALTPANGVTVRLTGQAPLADEEMTSLEDGAEWVGAVMIGAMGLTLWWATRSLRLVAAIGLTTGAGLVCAAALGLAVIGRFNIVSVAFVPLFVGLGVDFAIQLVARFRAERLGGTLPAPALAAAGAALGPSLLLAGASVTLGFLAFLPTAYVGVAELGVIAAMGMLVALALSVTLLPALILLLGARPRGEAGWAGAAPLDRWVLRRRRAILAAFAVAMVASIAALPLVRFDFDPVNLRDPNREAMATLAALMADPDRRPDVIQLVEPSLAAARVTAAQLEALPEVARAITVEAFVPADQPAKLAALADAAALLELTLDPLDIAPPATDAETVMALRAASATLRDAAARDPGGAVAAGRLAAAFDALATGPPAARRAAARAIEPPLITTLAAMRAALAAKAVTLGDLPLDLRRDWLTPDGRARIAVFPAAPPGDQAGAAAFTRAVLTVAPHATGAPVATQAAAATIARAFVEAGALALALVAALLFAVLRSAREVAFTLAPVALSIFLTLATCVAIGQPINFANIIAFPLLFGVGVAFHIYFVVAWRNGAADLLQSSLARAIFFSALATGTAFGSVWLSGHPGTASMGKVLMLSLVWTLVCALIFEPALLGPARATSRPAARG